jgi:NAD(P)-dependent dehydrogenase (short-subunit alcohol dehydrogenase family)
MDLGFQGKVAIVTGGSKGIGEAIVRGLIDEGANVVNANRPGREGDELQQRFPSQLHFIETDLCNSGACAEIVEAALQRFGRIDILVNNAGVNDSVGLDAGLDTFQESLRRNLLHVYDLVHHSLEQLKANQGAVVNIGSKVASTGQGGTSGYAAAKGAICGLTREWAVDLAPHGIRVNAVIPAEVWTPLYEKWIASLDDPQATQDAIENLVPLHRRFTSVRELADMVVFLASERSSHTTGQIIYVDGGYTHLDRKCTS